MRLDHVAAQTWNQERSIEDTSNVIHDGARTNDELRERAKGYVSGLLFGSFLQAVPGRDASILEIGSGLGWIMQAMNEYLSQRSLAPRSVVGLDIAPNMIEMAKRRLGTMEPFSFLLYDGLNVPLSDSSLDLIYSVAALQHVPRPFVFNLFFEIRRLLKQKAFAILHFLSTDCLAQQELHHSWRNEITNQISGANTHWHHFYSAKELRDVLAITGFSYVAVRDDGGGCLVCCVSNSPLELPKDFDASEYLRINVDVHRSGDDPAVHYMTHGHQEGRRWKS
jgi:ubiquinone/menaquinone biosynthesis C-methylase UbiE